MSVASINNRGELDSKSNYGPKINLASPGIDILCILPNNQYSLKSGTSYAAPFVSGVVALVLQYKRNISNTEIINEIIFNVKKLDSLKGKIASEGIINADFIKELK